MTRATERAGDRRRVVRRRRLALAVVASVAALLGGYAGSRESEEEDDSTPAAETPPTCPPAVVADPGRLAGQMLLVRMEASATEGLRRRVRRGRIGGVVLFPPGGSAPEALGREIEALRAAAAAGGAPAPLVAIDQEGGEVKRLPGAPPDRSPVEIAAEGGGAAFAEGRATGRALAELGIDVDLAPVLDVAGSAEAFIASRAFGSEPEAVAALGRAFGEGVETEGVAATAKHFPGLGMATVNTDLAPTAIDAPRAELEPGLGPFRAAIEAGFDLVMVSNAVYPAYDAERPASQSPRLIDGLLRRRLGFDGVVVTDDLGAGALLQSGIGEATAAVGAAGAGADLLLFALSDGDEARRALVRGLRAGDLDRERLLDSCARTTALRERLASPSAVP